VDTDLPSINVCYEIKTGGTLIVHDLVTTPSAPAAQQGPGSWTLEDKVFKCTYQFPNGVKRSVQANLSADERNIKGFRGAGTAVTGKGQLDISK
jgi:hypothetical protein